MTLPRALAALFAFATSIATAHAIPADAASLSGSWSGGGKVQYGDTREKASCRARFSRSGSAYSMNAACATPSGRVDQSAEVFQVGPNRYRGNFVNSQYGISGTISISVRGDTMSVNLSGGSSTGSLQLSRR